jgi:glycosyltransferase involved in cell wall biosynthesis
VRRARKQIPSSHFKSAAVALPNIKYYGPVLGDAKKEFFAELNTFVFPTRYRNEAEPLVILEALMNGCPVVANNRGCIRSMLTVDVGDLT